MSLTNYYYLLRFDFQTIATVLFQVFDKAYRLPAIAYLKNDSFHCPNLAFHQMFSIHDIRIWLSLLFFTRTAFQIWYYKNVKNYSTTIWWIAQHFSRVKRFVEYESNRWMWQFEKQILLVFDHVFHGFIQFLYRSKLRENLRC